MLVVNNNGRQTYRYRCGTDKYNYPILIIDVSYTCGRQTYRYPCGIMNYAAKNNRLFRIFYLS